MARLFVTNDNQTARVEIEDPVGEGIYYAACVGCGVDLVRGARSRFNIEDSIEDASIHVDSCKRCADADCRTEGRHDAGHRCRKS
jgi:hypothetical protein